MGDKIDITVKEDFASEKNSILKFSVPVSKSTTISITKNEENRIVSKKIITKFYKKRILSQNVIKKNLYSSKLLTKLNLK